MNNEITTVVIVDDEPIDRMDLKEMLESKGYSVVAEARDGFDAIAECKKHNPKIAFMDIKMPMMDGLSAARVIPGGRTGANYHCADGIFRKRICGQCGGKRRKRISCEADFRELAGPDH